VDATLLTSRGFSNDVVSFDFNRLNRCKPAVNVWSRAQSAGKLHTSLPSSNPAPRARDAG